MSVSAPQRLLRDFYKREARRLASLPQQSSSALSAMSSSPSASTSASTSLAIPSSPSLLGDPSQLQWTPASNPFQRRRKPESSTSASAIGRSNWLEPVYSIRRQKMLVRALGEVQLVDSLSHGPSAPSSSWKLPEGPKSSKVILDASSFDINAAMENDAARADVDPWSQGPYKGRAKLPFKQHKWERQRESIRAERQEKLRNMPVRIADYVKVRRDVKARLLL
jgi:hypothetical protein